jgi:hypothetical protein
MTAVKMLDHVVSTTQSLLKVQDYCDELFDTETIDVYTNILNYSDSNECKPNVVRIILNGLSKLNSLPLSILEAFNSSGLLLSISTLLNNHIDVVLDKSNLNI